MSERFHGNACSFRDFWGILETANSAGQVMVHTCRGLRSAKEGLNLAILVKTLRKERDGIAERLTVAEAELKRIHHSYTEMMTSEVAAR